MLNQLRNNNFTAYLIMLLSLTLTSCSHTYREYINEIKDAKAELTSINEKVAIKPTDKMLNFSKYPPLILFIYFDYKVKDIRTFSQAVKSAALEEGYIMPNEMQLKRRSKDSLFLCSTKSKDRYLEILHSENDNYSIVIRQDGDEKCY